MYDLDEKAISKIEEARRLFIKKDISFISQNCIGGVIYHDMEMKFLTPTINLYLDAKDFIKFVNNLDYYLNKDLVMIDADVITGVIDDITLYFLHYNNSEEAFSKWNERKNRIIKDNIFVIQTDRDGFDDELFEEFKKIKYPKVLITCNEKWKNEKFVIYLDNYKNEECVLDTIPLREFYKDNKIIRLINEE